LPIVVLIVVLIAGLILIARNFDDLRAAARQVGAGAIGLSFLFAVLGTAAVGQVWLNLLRGLGATVQTRSALSMFFVTQLAKYLPGSVWPAVAQMEYGHRFNTPRRLMLAANLLMLAVVTATGLIVGAAFLPWSSADGLHQYWPVFLALIPLTTLLYPRTIPAALDWLFRLGGREPLGLRVTNRRMLLSCAWGLAVWALLGLHVLVLTRALGASGFESVGAAVGGMALGFAAGLIFIPAPAGAGVRDAVLVATLSGQIGTTSALAVALASRVLLIFADVSLAAAGAVIGRRMLQRAAVRAPRIAHDQSAGESEGVEQN
jgi:glycosyltransferase 2 family protein